LLREAGFGLTAALILLVPALLLSALLAALTVRILLLLLSGLLATALLLTGLLARVLVLLARILVLVGHSGSPLLDVTADNGEVPVWLQGNRGSAEGHCAEIPCRNQGFRNRKT
jgi:hypothetical protein